MEYVPPGQVGGANPPNTLVSVGVPVAESESVPSGFVPANITVIYADGEPVRE